MTCDKCNHEMQIGEFPFCPHDHQANGVIGDDIPGGLVLEHGLQGTFYTKSSIAKAAKAKGLHWGAFLTESPHGRRWV